MILVEDAPEITSLFAELSIFPQHLAQTVNDNTVGVITDDASRVVLMRWFDDDHVLLVDARITQKHVGPEKIRVNAVRPTVALWLRPAMPAGLLDRSKSIHDNLYIVAKSFGLPVTCHPSRAGAHLYAGPWDGKHALLSGQHPATQMLIIGTFNESKLSCELVWALDLGRYRTWFAEHLKHSVTVKTTPSMTEYLVAHRDILEALVGKEWFLTGQDRKQNRPLFTRWQLCNELIATGGRVTIPNDLEKIKQMLAIMSEGNALIEGTKGDRSRISLGSFANYGDVAVQARIRAEAIDRTKFGDMMTEIFCAGWHLGKGHDVVATQDHSMPDLRIIIPRWTMPIYAECKRRTGTPDAAWLAKRIKEANSQIRSVPDEGAGIVYLDVSTAIDADTEINDDVPRTISVLEHECQRLLQRHYTSVSAVVLFWKEYIIKRSNDGVPVAACFLRWRSRVVRHIRPLVSLPHDSTPIAIAQTLMIRVIAASSKATD